MDTTGRGTTLKEALKTHNIDKTGVIVDVSGSVPEDEVRKIALAASGIPSSVITAMALTDTRVILAGTKDTVIQAIRSGRQIGGGTDFEKVVKDAWEQMGKPPTLILVSDGETPSWPKPFPVPTVLLIIDRKGHDRTDYGWNVYWRNMPKAGEQNVIAIDKVVLPELQDRSRGLE